MLLSLPVVAAAALVPATGLYYFIKSKFGMYIQRSIDDDLSMISAVYNNGKGCFLVAVEKQSNNNNTGKDKIVGIIGGHDRQDGVVEIRRMSVSYASQGVGLGRKLIKRLEEECRPAKMFLTCTSMQYAAHRLYSKAGFVLQDTFTPGITASWLLRNSILILLFEKRYIDN
jgi:GNAT superfamily N-acetyltransferase